MSKTAEDSQGNNRLKMKPNVATLLALLFLAATIVGLYCGYSFSQVYPLNSDLANAGLFPMEVMQGNFEYVLPANNPYFFTDYAIHMVIQPLTGYSPDALRLTGYAIYVLIVLACAAVAYRLAGRMEALAAAALVANLPFMGLQFVLYPLYHNGTTLFILLSILVYYADRPPFSLSFRWRVLIITLLQFLGVFSDTLMLPLFTLPLLAYSAYRFWKQRQAKETATGTGEPEGSPLLLMASTVPALIIYIVKSRIGQLWPGGPILITTGADLGSPGNLLQHPEMLSAYTGALISNSGGIVIALVILTAIAYVILDRKDRFLQAVLVCGGLIMLAGFMSMTIAGEPARYLTPVVIIALVVVATGTMRRGVGYVPLIIVAAVVLVYVWSNVQIASQPAQDYDAIQQELITFLESENITHAYSEYWSANVYTYLSGGKVMIVPVYVDNDKLRSMSTSPRWAETWPDGNDTMPVLITHTGGSLDNWAKKVNEDHPPEITYELGQGWIYVYNGTLPAWPVATTQDPF